MRITNSHDVGTGCLMIGSLLVVDNTMAVWNCAMYVLCCTRVGCVYSSDVMTSEMCMSCDVCMLYCLSG